MPWLHDSDRMIGPCHGINKSTAQAPPISRSTTPTPPLGLVKRATTSPQGRRKTCVSEDPASALRKQGMGGKLVERRVFGVAALVVFAALGGFAADVLAQQAAAAPAQTLPTVSVPLPPPPLPAASASTPATGTASPTPTFSASTGAAACAGSAPSGAHPDPADSCGPTAQHTAAAGHRRPGFAARDTGAGRRPKRVGATRIVRGSAARIPRPTPTGSQRVRPPRPDHPDTRAQLLAPASADFARNRGVSPSVLARPAGRRWRSSLDAAASPPSRSMVRARRAGSPASSAPACTEV